MKCIHMGYTHERSGLVRSDNNSKKMHITSLFFQFACYYQSVVIIKTVGSLVIIIVKCKSFEVYRYLYIYEQFVQIQNIYIHFIYYFQKFNSTFFHFVFNPLVYPNCFYFYNLWRHFYNANFFFPYQENSPLFYSRNFWKHLHKQFHSHFPTLCFWGGDISRKLPKYEINIGYYSFNFRSIRNSIEISPVVVK